MKKSNNYYKFMKYVSYGKRYVDTICKDNGVLECTSYCTVSDIEYYENTTLGVENDWLKIKNVLVNEEVIYVYYVKGERTFHIATFILDNFKTQKELKHAIHKAVDKFFINNVDIIKDTETSEAETSEIEDLDEDENEYKEISDVEDVCGDCSHFNACMQDYETNASMCSMFDSLNKAIKKPEWHHVSLSTLTNLDFDMLDEKRQLYLSLYREIKELIKDLHNCKSCHTYEKRLAKIYSRNADLVDENKVTSDYIRYVTRKVSMCNVECGVWTSANEESTGYHKSRRYNQATLRH